MPNEEHASLQSSDYNKNKTNSDISPAHKVDGVMSIFTPVKGYFVTPLIINLNILVFILMVLSGIHFLNPDSADLISWGANFRPSTLSGQAWRLFANLFLHSGIVHLLLNMYALMYIGMLLELRIGSRLFGIGYIVAGIVASVASIYWNPTTVSAGASGAIFGMYGIFLALLTTDAKEKTNRKSLFSGITVFIGYNLLSGITGGVDYAAHLGGLISGIILGYSFYPGLKNPIDIKLKYGLPALTIILLFFCSSWLYWKIPDNIIRYERGMKIFVAEEKLGMRIYQMPQSASKEILMAEIKDHGLPVWRKEKDLIAGLDKMNLPKGIHTRNKMLLEYCDLRIESLELIYKSISENTGNYNDQIKKYSIQITSILDSLKK